MSLTATSTGFPMAALDFPAQQLMVFEAYSNHGDHSYHNTSSTSAETVHMCSFCDGHVKLFNVNRYAPKRRSPAYTDIHWWINDAPAVSANVNNRDFD